MKIFENISRNFMDIDSFLSTEFKQRNKHRAKRTLKSIITEYINKL